MDRIKQIANQIQNMINFEVLIHIILILFIGILFIKILSIIIKRLLLKGKSPQLLMVAGKMVNYSGFAILSILIFAELGIELSTLLGAAGIFGIAIGIASQKSLGNIISGFFMVSEKCFEIGDVIKVGDKTGIVYSVELLSIMLRTFDNILIRIPNETLISADVTNITRFSIRRMDIWVSTSFTDDISKTMDLFKEIAKKNVLCLDEPTPFVLVKSFEDSGILFQFGVWFEKTDYVNVRNSIMTDIIVNFEKAGITIPYPHITLDNEVPLQKSSEPFLSSEKPNHQPS